MKTIKVKDEIDLNILLKYGFKITGEEEIFGYNIYGYFIEQQEEYGCCILINTIEHEDRILRFNYYDDLCRNIEYEELDECGEPAIIGVNPIDYDIKIPAVLFEMFQDNIIEIC